MILIKSAIFAAAFIWAGVSQAYVASPHGQQQIENVAKKYDHFMPDELANLPNTPHTHVSPHSQQQPHSASKKYDRFITNRSPSYDGRFPPSQQQITNVAKKYDHFTSEELNSPGAPRAWGKRDEASLSHPLIFSPEPVSRDVPYLKVFNSISDFETGRKQLEENTEGLITLIGNTDSKSSMRWEMELTYSKMDIYGHRVQHEGNPLSGWNLLLPRQIAAFGNLPEPRTRPPGKEKYLAASRAQYCDGKGESAVGHVDWSNKLEWNYDAGRYEKLPLPGRLNINHSMVDGFNMPANISFSASATCKPLHCSIPASVVKSLCPTPNLLGTDEHPICISDCKLTKSPEHCCTDGFDDIKKCPKSNMYLKDVCEFSYAYAHDDHMYQGNCDPGKYMVWGLGGGSLGLDL
ncbi:uncharacterized protein PAC_13587 [Phialocephala subalpina]|uniref:Uncharacterized protein n=1 Tax=Phialocephala subalpina TaxID=576137 RepID=A0A1L7XF72_9HELO|nr:uncharacterized protein PAC_13587 [Phialocephala subalpina]